MLASMAPDRSALIRMTNEDTWEALVGFSDSRYGPWDYIRYRLSGKTSFEECYIIQRENIVHNNCDNKKIHQDLGSYAYQL